MGPRRTRVAVVQLAYHPAILLGRRSLREAPLLDPSERDVFEVPGHEVPPPIEPRLADLRRRVRETYDAQLLARVRAILETCRRWNVEVVVFPEYSIPWEILDGVAEVAGPMVVVAGTHTVERAARKKDGIYQRLGLAPEAMPSVGQSAAPVLHGARLLGMSVKLKPSRLERDMKEGTHWAPIEMPEGTPGPMGVMVCLDFLHREGDAHRTLVTEELGRCRFLAVPSLTPAHSLPEFAGKAWEEARRYGRPVLYCDGSKDAGGGGGTSIYVDEGHEIDLKRFPEHAGWLAPEDEGVVVADVDLGYERPGKSTRYAESRPVIPVAAATLVYRATSAGDAYAAWLDESSALLARDDDDALEELVTRVTDARELLQQAAAMPGGAARARRLSQLLRDVERVTSVEEIRQLTREVVLPAGVLPLPAVQSALAKGAADELRRWSTEAGAGFFAAKADALLDACAALDRKLGPLTKGGQQALHEVIARVRGGAKPAELRAVMAYVDVIEDDLVEPALEEESQKAKAQIQSGRYREARDTYVRMLERLNKAVEHAAALERHKLKVWAERCKLGAAVATIQLQELDQAKERLATVDAGLLPPKARLSLAEARILVGELSGAEELLSGLESPEKTAVLRQRIALRRGEIPEPLADVALVRAEAAAAWLDRNDLARAAAVALEALGQAELPLATPFAIMVLTTALGRTIFENPPNGVLVPVERRADVVNALEKGYEGLRGRELPPSLRRDLDRTEEWFGHLAYEEDDRLAERYVARGGEDAGEDEEAPRRRALQLAIEGHTDDALRALPEDPTGHPWRRRFDRVQLLALGKQFDRALDEAMPLVRDFPERAPIEHITSQLYAQIGRSADALRHAEVAYRQLPGKGLRLWLAGQYLSNERAAEAWRLVEKLTDERPLALRTRANAALATGHLEEAESAWKRYVELRPEDVQARVQYAQLLFRRHRPEEAADVAWKVYAEHGDRLGQEALYLCGSLQRLAGELDVEHRRRIHAVAARLKERFPSTAGPLRVQLFLTLGESLEGADPNDFDQLVAQGQATVGHGISELEEMLDQRRALQDGVARLEQLGAIPLSTASALAGTPLATVIVRILERHAAGFVCPPVSLTDVPPAVDLTKTTLLVSELELLLLEVLDLVPTLRAALGSTGRVVIFSGTRSRIEEDFAKLRSSANRRKLSETENLLRQIERLPALDPDPAMPYDDAATARRHAGAIIADEAPQDVLRIAPRAFLRYLRVQGCIDGAQHDRIEPYLPREATQANLDALPDRVVMPGYLVELLFQADALFAVFRAHPGSLFMGPGTRPYALVTRNDLADTIRAEELAGKVHAMLNQGWIQEEREPEPLDLPPLRDPNQHLGDDLVREPLREVLRVHQAMVGNPGWLRLTAEFYGTLSLGSPELIGQLAWPSTDAYLAIVQQMRRVAGRTLTVPALVSLLIPDAQEAYVRLRRLAELGFPDALGASEVLRLERQYNGLNGVEPRRILDNAEWMARMPEHLASKIARLRLSRIYAQAMFDAFCNGDGSPAEGRTQGEKAALAHALLARQGVIGAMAVTNSLDQLLGLVAVHTVNHRLTAWKQEGEAYAPDRSGPAGTLWKTIEDWAGQDKARQAARGRAIRDVWLALDQWPGGPALVDSVTLEFMSASEHAYKNGASFVGPEMETLAILSALWEQSPLRDMATKEMTYEDIFRFYASAAANAKDTSGDGRVLLFEGGNERGVPVPLEAIFLRGTLEQRATMAHQVKILQGVHDGELYRLANAIEGAPGDVDLLHKYARRAATALFRTVRDDPPFLRTWAQSEGIATEGAPTGIDDLLRVLSEPTEPLPAGPIHKVLRKRLEGVQSPGDRENALRLFGVASQIPGLLVAAPLPWLLMEADYNDRVGAALDHLALADESPIARISGAIIFLRVAATRRPIVALPSGTVDLREMLPALLERVLAKVIDKPTPDTYATAEAPLLRVCGDVVQRLAHPTTLPLREGLWLTWRLFQWLCLQLDAISPDARLDGIQRLVKHEPKAQVRRDVLDPFGFGREPGRFDHRLGAVLHALGAMEELAVVFRQQQPKSEVPEPRSVSSPGLEDRLLELARGVHSEPPVGSVLDWDAPDNVPDLALRALLHLNADRFAELTPEARSRRFSALPDDPAALQDHNPAAFTFATKMLLAAASLASKLPPEERALLEAKLRAMVDSPTSRFWRWVTFVGLFEAGVAHLEDEARSLTVEHIKDPMAPLLTGWLLLGIAKRDRLRVEPAVEALLAAAETSGADVVGIATGLGRLLVHGTPEAKRLAGDIFLRLAERPALGEDPRMTEVIGFFRLREGQA